MIRINAAPPSFSVPSRLIFRSKIPCSGADFSLLGKQNSLLSLCREFRRKILNLQIDSMQNLLAKSQILQNSLQMSLFAHA